MATTDEYLTVKEAAQYLGISPNTVRNWGAAGSIPEYRHPVNNYRLFRLADLKKLKRDIERPRKG